MKLLLILLLVPFVSYSQKQIGDTIWVNNTKIIPGDTVHLGGGSDPDKNYIYIFTPPKPMKLKSRYLGKNAPYLIYIGRQDFGYNVQKYFLPVFAAPNDKNRYIISFPQAIETKEVLIN